MYNYDTTNTGMNNAIWLTQLEEQRREEVKTQMDGQKYDFDQLLKHEVILHNRDDMEDILRDKWYETFQSVSKEGWKLLEKYFDERQYIEDILSSICTVYISNEKTWEAEQYWFFPIEHNMEDAGDTEHQVLFCTMCGYPNKKEERSEPY